MLTTIYFCFLATKVARAAIKLHSRALYRWFGATRDVKLQVALVPLGGGGDAVSTSYSGAAGAAEVATGVAAGGATGLAL